MTYTIETVRTVAGKRYYIRQDGAKLMRSGFATRALALERIAYLQAMDALNRATNALQSLKAEREVA